MIRIAIFGSFYRGFYVLDELMHGPYRDHFQIVGVATDDLSQKFVSADRRVWQYDHKPEEETMVERLARENEHDVYKGRVKDETFYDLFSNSWRPDMCVACTFGQRIDSRLFDYPRLGFYNLHPCIEGEWPSKYAGPNPFAELIADGLDHTQIALHRIDAGFDTGELIGMSPRIAIPPAATVVDMHKLTSPAVAKYAIGELAAIAQNAAIRQLAEMASVAA